MITALLVISLPTIVFALILIFDEYLSNDDDK